jgi:stage V sporulation protein B
MGRSEPPPEPSDLPVQLGKASPGTPTTGSVHSLQSLGHGSLLALIGQVFLVGALFGVRILLVTRLSPEDWNAVALTLALVGFIGAVGTLGLPQAVARQLAHTVATRDRKRLVVNSILLTLPAAAVAGGALFLLASPLASALSDPSLTPVLEFFAGYLALGTVSGLLASFFQGNEDVLPNTLFNQVLSPGLALVFLFSFLEEGLGLTGALLAYLLSALVTLAGLTLYTLSRRGRPWERPMDPLRALSVDYETNTAGSLLLFALPLGLVAVAAATVGTADTIVLGVLSPSHTQVVGPYNAVLPMARLVALGGASLGYIMLPVASHLHRVGDMEELRRSYTTITKWILLITLPFFLLFFLLPGPSLYFVYGSALNAPGYGNATILLQITALGSFVATIMGPSPSVLIGLGRLRLLLYDTVASALTDVLLSVALVPFLGSEGAAIAFASATALLPILCVVQTHLLEGIHPFHGVLARPLVALSLPVAAVFLLAVDRGWEPSGWWLPGLFGLLFLGYLLAIPATRSMEMEDGQLLSVVEAYLGRPLPFLRRLGRYFVGRGP